MPKAKKEPATKQPVAKAAPVKATKLANVRISITHIVPTTRYGNVTYRAECEVSQAADVGVFMAELIGTLYPPYNPGEIVTEPVSEVATVKDVVEMFNGAASEIQQENADKKDAALADEFQGDAF